jgi:hypothetical protein
LFADECKLTMDESVMEDLNTNISGLLKENQAALENTLKQSMGTAISQGFENFAALMLEQENQEQFLCIQCGLVFIPT